MKRIVLKDGYTLEISKDIIESWDFIDLVSESDENPLKSVKVLKMLLGDQIEGLKEHLGGKPKASEMFDILKYIIEHFNDDEKKS